MDGIYGLIHFDESAIEPPELLAMERAMAFFGTQQQCTRVESFAAIGQVGQQRLSVAEDQTCRNADGSALVAAARIDNRTELGDLLEVPRSERNTIASSKLIAKAYLKWGAACVERIFGDWSFAVWHPRERRLFLARDHHGNTALYYTATARYFAFASSRKALLALPRSELRAIDDLYLAQLLLSWPVYHGERTAHSMIRRLPPAHSLVASAQGVSVQRYWWPERVEQRECSLAQAVEGFLPLFDAAVASRAGEAGALGVTLSGGLDSGAVTVSLARTLQAQQRHLIAYTYVPGNSRVAESAHRFGNEWDLAHQTASRYANVEHHRIVADATTPLEATRESLWIHDEPQHAAGNVFWWLDLVRMARNEGCKTLLTGQGGNAGISWPGALPWVAPASGRELGRMLLSALPARARVAARTHWLAWMRPWERSLAISKALVERTHVLWESVGDHQHPVQTQLTRPREQRLAQLNAGRTIVGCLHAEIAAAQGLAILDPTLDARVLSYCLSLPDDVSYDSRAQLDRMLIRTAMVGRLPDAVRLNRKRGMQSSDLVFRLRADRDAMEACMEALERGAAREYLDLARLRQAWSVILAREDLYAHREASVVLLRAVMVGLFVNQPAGEQHRPASLQWPIRSAVVM